MGSTYKYYRLLYSIFAAVTLGFLVWYHFSIVSAQLFHIPILQYAVATIIGIPGIIIMAICINKYFYKLSGVQAFSKKQTHTTLQQTGMHKYVRHPLYLGTLMFVWGIFFLFPMLNNLIACGVMNIYILIGIHWEEKQLLIEYGESYRKYAEKVPGLIPRIFIQAKK